MQQMQKRPVVIKPDSRSQREDITNDPREVEVSTIPNGTVFECCRFRYRKLFSNGCRALVQPVSKKTVVIKPKLGDKPIIFDRDEEGLSIAPSTMVVVIDEAEDLI